MTIPVSPEVVERVARLVHDKREKRDRIRPMPWDRLPERKRADLCHDAKMYVDAFLKATAPQSGRRCVRRAVDWDAVAAFLREQDAGPSPVLGTAGDESEMGKVP